MRHAINPGSLLDARQPPGLTWSCPDRPARGFSRSHCLCLLVSLPVLAAAQLLKSTTRPDTLFSQLRDTNRNISPPSDSSSDQLIPSRFPPSPSRARVSRHLCFSQNTLQHCILDSNQDPGTCATLHAFR
ncbi:hypothetical protein LY78DRAFT_435574 [Colletotrichum sublineola]|nr:hypothetical protein LY78DRAFT_435574 [Colletotrichum sublineola]